MKKTLLEKAASNWKSGITVALVSIPLSVSLAVASGTSPVAGIITAIWAGLIASIWGGSNYNIIGPTGALSGLLAAYVLLHGAGSLPMLALVTGVFVLIAYVLKLERYLVFVPASAIQGFTLGVALIISLNQFNFAFGLSGLPTHERFIQNVFESFANIGSFSPVTFIIFALFLAALFLFIEIFPRIPGAIVLAPIGILIGYLSSIGILPFTLGTLGSKFPNMDATLFSLPSFSFESSLITAGLAVALVAILETMISAKIADGMTKTKHNKRKEMFGLGLANIGSGLAGGIPATAALARTALNVKTGANDKTSAMIGSIAVALISLIFLKYFVFIPLAVIAAILVFIAIRMVEADHFFRMYKLDKKGFVLAIIVAGVTVYEDPIIGILFGTAVALIIFMEKLSRGQFELIVNDANKKIVAKVTGEELKDLAHKSHTLVYSIKGQLAYINAQSHIARFETTLNGYEHIVLRLRELYFVDLDGIDAFSEIVELIEAQGKKVYVSSTNLLMEKMLEESAQYRTLVKQGRVFERTTDALRFLGYHH